MRRIYLEPTDLKRLRELCLDAEAMPAIRVGPGPDLAASAWERVRRFMDELGERYGYDSKMAAINSETGEVVVRDE